MLLSAAIWLQNIGLMRALRESDRGYETLLALHVSCISLFAAMILLTDLRLLNVAPRGYSVSDIVDQLRVPKRIGFLCVATFGFLMFGMKAEEYYLNIFFRIKVLLFLTIAVHAFVFRPRVYNRAADLDERGKPPVRAQVAAVLSLFLWFGVVCAGRGIGYIHPPPFSHHFDLSRATQTPAAPSKNDAAVMLPSDSIHSFFQEKGAHDAHR